MTPDAPPRRLSMPPLDAALKPFQRLGVRARLLLALSFLALFGVGVATVFHLSALADFTVGSMVQDARQITQQATTILDKELATRSGRSLEDVIKGDKNLTTFLNASIGPYPYVQYIAVVDRNGIVLAATTRTLIGDTLEAAPQATQLLEQGALAKLIALQKNRDYELVQPIGRSGSNVGAIRVGMASSFVRKGLATPFRQSLALALAAMILAVLLAFVLAELTTRPLYTLLGAIEKLGKGEFGQKLEASEADQDLVRLFSSFNTMSERLAEDRTVIEVRNRQLQALVDGLEDGVLMVEKSGRIAQVNPTVCRVLRRPEQELVGEDVAAALGASHPVAEVWREALAQSGARERSDVRLDTDARGDHYLLLAYPVPSGTDPQGVVITLRNSDSLRKLTSILDESHRMIAWGQVALGVAHEIKNPLQAMNLNLELAREKIIRDGAGVDMTGPLRNLGVVGQQIHRLDEVVNAFLRFARMTHAQREPLPLNSLVSEVVGLVASEADRYGTEIRFAPKPGLPTPYGDRGMLYQVVLNLVQNAVQAGPHKGPIDVRIEEGANRGLTIEVQDRGKGIKRTDHSRIFELFYTTRPDGSGIGLAIVQRALQLHGGTVEIESEEGKGTTVRAWLPLNVPLDSQPANGHRAGVAAPVALLVALLLCGCSHHPKPSADMTASADTLEIRPVPDTTAAAPAAKKASHPKKPRASEKTAAVKPATPPAPAAPEPNAGVVSGSSTSAPVDTVSTRKEVVPQLSEEERKELEKSSREQIDAARSILSGLDAAKLDAEKQRKLLIAQGFIADALAARTQQDWMRASQLATKAKVLADELSTN